MAAPELAAGHVIDGHTTVAGVLARGARVTAHEGVTALGRQVVIKLYDPALGAASLVALQAAADVTRDLPRGQALEVLDVGVDGVTGGAFVVTERSARPSLAHLVQLCPLSPDEVVALVKNLARALGGAHDKGLPHLGLKPTNVFVGAPPACEVQLADFGATVARATKAGADVNPESAPWLSPEQAFGGLPPGVGSDVFSTALVVFFALTGRSYWHSFSAGGGASAWARENLGRARAGLGARRGARGLAAGDLGHPLRARARRGPGTEAAINRRTGRVFRSCRARRAGPRSACRERPALRGRPRCRDRRPDSAAQRGRRDRPPTRGSAPLTCAVDRWRGRPRRAPRRVGHRRRAIHSSASPRSCAHERDQRASAHCIPRPHGPTLCGPDLAHSHIRDRRWFHCLHCLGRARGAGRP